MVITIRPAVAKRAHYVIYNFDLDSVPSVVTLKFVIVRVSRWCQIDRKTGT